MDADFMREMLVLLFFIGLYLGVSAMLLRGHHVDLSEVTAHNTIGGADAAAAETGPRLNRRRKAIARQAAAKVGKAPEVATVNDDDD